MGRDRGEGWVIAHCTGSSCLVLEAGTENLLWLRSGFCFACSFFAHCHVGGAGVSLTSVALPKDPLSPSPPSSQPNAGPQVGLPRSKQSRVLVCVQHAQSVSLCQHQDVNS